MQLFVKIALAEPLTLPLSYHHIVQAAIYELASHSDEEYGSAIHDNGAAYEKRRYKLFCFSSLHGPSRVRNKRITFERYMYFEIRSVDETFIRNIDNSLREYGIRFGERRYPVEYTKVKRREITDTSVYVHMLSPVTVRVTDSASGESRYLAPWEEEFPEQIRDNFRRKYQAYTGEYPESDVAIQWVAIDRKKDSYMTMYKGNGIRAWRGTYKLEGSPEALTFLYNTGIGSRNSQGFGMIELEEE